MPATFSSIDTLSSIRRVQLIEYWLVVHAKPLKEEAFQTCVMYMKKYVDGVRVDVGVVQVGIGNLRVQGY